MKKILTILFIAFSVSNVGAQCGITFTVSPNSALGINSVLLSLNGTDTHVGFSVGIDWGDGTPMSIGFEKDWVHTYSGPGTYQICVNFVAPTCIQDNFCNSYTVTTTPAHANLCPLTVTYGLSGNTLNTDATGSGAVSPSLSFHPDILSFIDNPFNMSDFQFNNNHTGSFSYTYSPPSPDQTYLFCVSYVDLDTPEACEMNDYCSSVTFGSPAASLGEDLDFLSTIEVYPVPASTYINIHFSDLDEFNNVRWKIISLDGKVIQNGILSEQTSTILLPIEMTQGNYRLLLNSDKKERVVNFVKL